MVDESHQSIPQIGAMYRGDRSRKETLVESGTVVVKCMLHISADEQKERLLARLDDPSKLW